MSRLAYYGYIPDERRRTLLLLPSICRGIDSVQRTNRIGGDLSTMDHGDEDIYPSVDNNNNLFKRILLPLIVYRQD